MNRVRPIQDTTCPTPAPQWTAPAPPVRAPGRCDDAPVLPDKQFVQPTPQTPPPDTFTEPAPVVVSNAETTVTCADLGAGPTGDSVTVAAAAISRTIYWSDIPALLRQQRRYIGSLDGSTVQALTSEGTSAATIASTLRLSPQQAEAFHALAAAARMEVAEQVRLNALARIQCLWLSEEQTATCPAGCAEDADSGYTIAAGIRNPVVVEAGRFTSRVSQEDANAQAQAYAEERLVCLFGNDIQTVDCETDLGKPERVPNDLVSQTPSGELRRGEFTVPADTYFDTTKEAANERARAAAIARLNCLYLSKQLVISCDDAVETAGADVKPSLLSAGVPGNPITVPAGEFVSSISQADADQQALDAATLLLECTFGNDEMVVTCPASTTPGVHLSADSEALSLTVPAGTYLSTSKAEANELALLLTQQQLGCIYCNDYIEPSCYPASYTPTPGQAIPLEDVTADWAENVVLGLAANTYCFENQDQTWTASVAASLQRPVQKEEGCLYLNDEVWVGCMPDLEGGQTPPVGGYHHPDYLDADFEDHPRFPGLTFAEKLSLKSRPTGSELIRIAAGQYPIRTTDVPDGEDPKVYANAQARLYALSLLDCQFTNPEYTWTCQNAWSPERFVQADVVQPGSNNQPVISITVPAGLFVSSTSFADAVEQARQAAIGSLNCYYTNDEVRVACWEKYGESGESPPLDGRYTGPPVHWKYGTGKVNYKQATNGDVYDNFLELQEWQRGSLALPSVIKAGTTSSDLSKADANQLAVELAIAGLECNSAARDAGLVCSDAMIVKCGGVAEAPPGNPRVPGVNGLVSEAWSYFTETFTHNGETKQRAVLRAGDGKLRVLTFNVLTSEWDVSDLGCSPDTVGGCGGPGIKVPAGIMCADTKEAANRLAYDMIRQQLQCFPLPTDPGSGDGDTDMLKCAFGFRVYDRGGGALKVCEGNVLAVSPSGGGVTTSPVFFQPSGLGTLYVTLRVVVNVTMRSNYPYDMTVWYADVQIRNSPPTNTVPQYGGGTFYFEIARVSSAGEISQKLNGDARVCVYSSPGAAGRIYATLCG